jgi:hypothetical protein
MTAMDEIPSNLKDGMLPADTLTAGDLLQYQLPIALPTLPASMESNTFFSTQSPNTHLLKALELPTPPKRFINSLCNALIRAIQYPEAIPINSVLIPYTPLGEGLRFDRFIITYWMDIGNVRVSKQKWAEAFSTIDARVKNLRLGERSRDLAQKASTMLTSLPWKGTLCGFTIQSPIHHLADLPTNKWLSSDHEDMMLDLLDRDMTLSSGTSMCLVQSNTAMFFPKMRAAFKDPTAYIGGEKSYAWLARIGDELASGKKETLATIVNVHRNHWVAIGIDVPTMTIWYGDPMGERIDGELEETLQWWVKIHFHADFMVKTMRTPEQRDGHSCGVLAYVALRNFVLPEQAREELKRKDIFNQVYEMKYGNTRLDAYDIQLKVFIDLASWHQEHVSSSSNTSCIDD